MPTKWYLFPLMIVFLPLMLLHELTHALAIWLELSTQWIIMLPMVTELPFFILWVIGFVFKTSLILAMICWFIGMLGIISLNGDFLSWKWYRDSYNDIPDLSKLFN